MRSALAIPLGIVGAAAAGLGYATAVEPHLFRVRRHTVPVLPAGSAPLRLLHISDIHMVSGQKHKQRWLRSLARLEPDLVINTGDNLSDPEAVGEVLDALGPLQQFPGAFVLGSNDYYRSRPLNPARYLRRGDPSHRPRRAGAQNDWRRLHAGLLRGGWVDLTNRRDTVKADNRLIAFAGVDDPHIRRDRYATISGGPDPSAALTIGVTHAPYRRVLDAMATDGLPLLIAGHTHGGQLRLPGVGTLVTNCDLDRQRARGLSRYGDAPGDQTTGRTSWLNVSAGCGASRYAPVRFACPPEASLLTLVGAPD
jgi:predicted MPP superfamily phosphohydrolase